MKSQALRSFREAQPADQLSDVEDPLSGLIGRGGFARRARRSLGMHLRSASALMVIEIDHFETITARFGSDCGDMVIRGVAQKLLQMVRDNDVVGRIDSTTFAVLHTEIDLAAVRTVGERLRRTVQSMGFFAEDGSAIPVTISIGIEVVMRTSRPEAPNLEGLISQAMDRVADARSAGCNRVVAP